jgi:alpha-ketoglutarate-dependent taurine dioxygenase
VITDNRLIVEGPDLDRLRRLILQSPSVAEPTEPTRWRGLVETVRPHLPVTLTTDLPDVLARRGWCVLHHVDAADDWLLLALTASLGEIDTRGNECSDQPIYDIRVGTPDNGGHQPLSRRAVRFSLHTDGAAFARPPRWVVLACVASAHTGGRSLISRLDDILTRLPDHTLQTCRQRRFRSIASTESLPIFFPAGHGEEGIRYREHHVHAWPGDSEAADALRSLAAAVDSAEPEHVPLTRGDVLFLDNARVLHGREEFPANSARHLRRLRLTDPALPLQQERSRGNE